MKLLFDIIASVCRFLFQRNRVTILVYHSITPLLFEEHVRRLSKSYSFISFNEYIDYREGRLAKLPKYPLIFTFDDGYKENYNLLEVFKKYSVTPTIYLCTYPLNTNRSVWSSFVDIGISVDLLLRKEYSSILADLEKKGFNSNTEYQDRKFLSFEEINIMKEFVDFQSHTANHANLAMATTETIHNELASSKRALEELGIKVHSICYPFSFYSQATIDIAKQVGYRFGLTVEPYFNSKRNNPFKLRRISMNESKPSLVLLKACGFYTFLKELVFRKKGMRFFDKNK